MIVLSLNQTIHKPTSRQVRSIYVCNACFAAPNARQMSHSLPISTFSTEFGSFYVPLLIVAWHVLCSGVVFLTYRRIQHCVPELQDTIQLEKLKRQRAQQQTGSVVSSKSRPCRPQCGGVRKYPAHSINCCLYFTHNGGVSCLWNSHQCDTRWVYY